MIEIVFLEMKTKMGIGLVRSGNKLFCYEPQPRFDPFLLSIVLSSRTLYATFSLLLKSIHLHTSTYSKVSFL